MNTTKNGGNAKAATAPATWHARFDAIIKAAKGDLGGPVPEAAWQAAPLLGAGKRTTTADCAEVLMIALTFRPDGISTNQYIDIRVAAGQKAAANNNCVAYLQQRPPVSPRGKYGHIVINEVDGRKYAHLTPAGAAHLKGKGMAARDIATLSRAPKLPKVPGAAKAKAPAKAVKAKAKPRKPVTRKPVTPAKPATPAPVQVAKPPVTVPPVTQQPATGNAGKPQA